MKFKKTTDEKIQELEERIHEHETNALFIAQNIGNQGVYYARTGDKELTMYIIDQLISSKSHAMSRGRMKVVREIDNQIDRIEEIQSTW